MIDPKHVRPLLTQLCVELGFCLPPAEGAKLCAHPPVTVTEFTVAVFVAEGMDPERSDRYLFRQVQDRVAEAFERSEEQRLGENL